MVLGHISVAFNKMDSELYNAEGYGVNLGVIREPMNEQNQKYERYFIRQSLALAVRSINKK